MGIVVSVDGHDWTPDLFAKGSKFSAPSQFFSLVPNILENVILIFNNIAFVGQRIIGIGFRNKLAKFSKDFVLVLPLRIV